MDVRVVYSHPQALVECRDYLARNLPQAEQRPSASTAAALDDMERSEQPAAAICSKRAAEGRAEIIDFRIQDRPDNSTRFIVLVPLASSPSMGEDWRALSLPNERMKELTKQQVQTLADTLGVPVGPEELDEVAARFNALLWTMDKIDNLEWRDVDPVTWVSRSEDV